MKKTLLVGLSLAMLSLQAEAGVVQNCSCAGRCSSGTVCNCATNTCAKQRSPYAYGYIDTRSPVYAPTYTAPTYQPTAPYMYSGEPAKKYGSNAVRPYIAARFMVSQAMADFEHTQDTLAARALYKTDIDDTIFGGAVAFGVNVNNFRLEAEGALHSNAEANYPYAPMIRNQNKTAHEIQAMSLLFNAYYDFPVSSVIKPYIGAGLGVGRLKNKFEIHDPAPAGSWVDLDTHTKSKTNFIWQIGAGISFALQEKLNMELGYRYTSYGKMDALTYQGPVEGGIYMDEKFKVKDYRTHTLSLGLRFDM